jgi:hypothetical protein
MASGTIEEQKNEVVKVATNFFDTDFLPENVIVESLTYSTNEVIPSKEALISSFEEVLNDFSKKAILNNPIAIWLERTVAIRNEGMHKRRNEPQSLKTIEDMIRLKLQAGMAGGNGILQGGKAVAGAAANAVKESVNLSESQLFLMISKIVERHRKLDEGLMDTIKGAAGKAVGSVVNYAKTKGTNLTTKITADKLLQAWKKADSPMDSATVAKVMQDAGVPAASVQQAYSTMKIPFDAAPAAPAAPASGPGDPTPLLSPAQLAAKRDPAATPAAPAATPAAPAATPAAPAAAAGKFPGEDPQGSNYVGRREVARQQAARAAAAAKPAPAKTPNFGGPTGYSNTNYTFKQPAAAPAAAPAAKPGIPSTGTSNSVFGRTSTSSTGGISQPTATGLRHTAKANNPNQPAVAESAGDELQSILKSAGLVRNR